MAPATHNLTRRQRQAHQQQQKHQQPQRQQSHPQPQQQQQAGYQSLTRKKSPTNASSANPSSIGDNGSSSSFSCAIPGAMRGTTNAGGAAEGRGGIPSAAPPAAPPAVLSFEEFKEMNRLSRRSSSSGHHHHHHRHRYHHHYSTTTSRHSRDSTGHSVHSGRDSTGHSVHSGAVGKRVIVAAAGAARGVSRLSTDSSYTSAAASRASSQRAAAASSSSRNNGNNNSSSSNASVMSFNEFKELRRANRESGVSSSDESIADLIRNGWRSSLEGAYGNTNNTNNGGTGGKGGGNNGGGTNGKKKKKGKGKTTSLGSLHRRSNAGSSKSATKSLSKASKMINLTKIKQVLNGASFPDALGNIGAATAAIPADGGGSEYKENDAHRGNMNNGVNGGVGGKVESLFPDALKKTIKTTNVSRKNQGNHRGIHRDHHQQHMQHMQQDHTQRQDQEEHSNNLKSQDPIGKNVGGIPIAMSILTEDDAIHHHTHYTHDTHSNHGNHALENYGNHQENHHHHHHHHHHDDGAPPASPTTTTATNKLSKSVKKAKKAVRDTTAKTYVATTVICPKIATAATHAATTVVGGVTNVVVEAASTAFHGANAIAGEVAEAAGVKAAGATSTAIMNDMTPARSNVTRNIGNGNADGPTATATATATSTRYADYVTDHNYQVILTPPPPLLPSQTKQPPTSSTPYHPNHKYACDPSTPGILIGAVAAGRCALSNDHPDHPEYLPPDIPRMLIIPEDWEERAGFVVNTIAATAGSSNGAMNGATGTGSTGGHTLVEIVPVAGKNLGKGGRMNGGASMARTAFGTTATTESGLKYNQNLVACPSNPIDMDEVDETADVVDGAIVEERIGNNKEERKEREHETTAEDEEEESEEESEDAFERMLQQNAIEEDGEEQDDDPRNHSMWVAAPDIDDFEDDDEIMDPSNVVMGDFDNGDDVNGIAQDDEFQHHGLVQTESVFEEDGTYYIGDIRMGFEGSPNVKALNDAMHMANALIGSVASGEDIDGGNIGDIRIGFSPIANITRKEEIIIEDGSVGGEDKECGESTKVMEEELNTVHTAVSDRNTHAGFEHAAGHYCSAQPDQQSFMNKRVLFEEEERNTKPEQLQQQQEPTSSDVSLFDNPFALNEQENDTVNNECTGFDDTSTLKHNSGKRVLKGRVLLVRIGKKFSKVKSKGKNALQQVFVLRPFGSSKAKNGGNDVHGTNNHDSLVLALPENRSMPLSPSAISVASIASSVITSGTNTKRFLGAVPVYSAPSAGFPYGAINYNRSMTESTMDGSDPLPPPPMNGLFPPMDMSDNPDEDAVSLLAAAINNGRHDENAINLCASQNSMGEAASSDVEVASDGATGDVKDVDEDESSVFLVVSPEDGGPMEAFEVVSGGLDGVTFVGGIHEMSDEHSDAAMSDIQPNNLSCLFTCNSQGSRGNSVTIIDAAAGGFELTPTAVNNNVSNVFRQSVDEASAGHAPVSGEVSNLLPGPTVDSDDEDETLLYHDGCTVIRQTSTFGENTIATATIEEDEVEKQREFSSDDTYASVREKVINESRAIAALIGTPDLSPNKPSFSRQAAKNGSFLFSPDNMGRAGPRIRAKERAALKQGHVAPSITMLPATKQDTIDIRAVSAVVESFSYTSARSDEQKERSALIAIEPTVAIRKSDTMSDSSIGRKSFSSVEVEIQKKPVMSSMTETRQFSFKSTMKKFSPHEMIGNTHNEGEDAAIVSEDAATFAKEESVHTPATDGQSKKIYPATPFPENLLTVESLDTLTAAAAGIASPSNSTSSSVRLFRKKPSPKAKTVPKSALKTRKGLVKERISDIQQRLEVNSAVTDVNGRLKRNHSYRLKSSRRLTNGDGVLAPRKAVLQNPMFVRSVPIGIAKSYSQDESDQITHYVEAKDSFEKGSVATSFIPEEEEEERLANSDSFSEHADDYAPYASKYATEKVNMAGVESPTRLNNGGNSFIESCRESDASSLVSEATEYDAFNALLGKMNVYDDESSSSDTPNTIENRKFDDAQRDKENADANMKSLSSEQVLPFKTGALVKPTEINQHDKRLALTHMSSRDLQLSPLQRTPMQAQKWRTMAVAAAEKKSSSGRFAGVKKSSSRNNVKHE